MILFDYEMLQTVCRPWTQTWGSGQPVFGLRGKHALYRFDHLAFGNGELSRTCLAPRGVVADLLGKAHAFNEVLDLHFAIGALVAALDDNAGAAATVGIFHLRLHAGAAKIEFGTYACLAQVRYHLLVATETFDILVHDQHHYRCLSLN